MKNLKPLFVILFFLSAGSLFGQSWFNFGLGVSNHTSILKGPDGTLVYNNTMPGFNCAYMSGERIGFYISANFGYLALMMANEGDGFSRYPVTYGFMGNFCMDISGGPAFTWELSGEKLKFSLGAGVHFAMPHIPWDSATGERLVNGFSAGLGAKAVLKFKYFYIGLDVNGDFLMFDSVFTDYKYFGFSFVPALGYTYNY